MLKMLGREEVDSVIEERGSVEVHCEFYNQPTTSASATTSIQSVSRNFSFRKVS